MPTKTLKIKSQSAELCLIVKKFIKKSNTLLKFFVWLKNNLLNLLRLKDVLMMQVLFHIWPEQTYRFSTRKLLPCKKNRYPKELRPIIPYDLLKNESSNIPRMKEIYLIGRGSSFDKNNLKDIKEPIFLAPAWGPLRIDRKGKIFHPIDFSIDKGKMKMVGHKRVAVKIQGPTEELFDDHPDKEYRQDNITYINNRPPFVKRFKKNGNNVISIHPHAIDEKGNPYPISFMNAPNPSIFDNKQCRRIALAEKIYKPPLLFPYPNWAPTYSFLPTLCALSFFADKINVYGWDCYLDTSPKNMNYWELFFNMYKMKYHDFSVFGSKNFFEMALVNFYFGYQLSKLPNINICSHMGELDKHEKLMKRIERVFFN